MGKCAWCGGYIQDSADKQAFNNAMGLMGLDLITKPLGKALIKQYCSKKCELEAKAAKGGGGGGGSGGSAPAAQTSSIQDSDAELKVLQAEKEKAQQATLESVIAVRFDGSPDDIAADLNGLMTRIKQTKSGVFASKEAKTLRASLLEKIEFGIMKLQKVDAESAAFFQKKFDELKK